jgi:hypothetical protein
MMDATSCSTGPTRAGEAHPNREGKSGVGGAHRRGDLAAAPSRTLAPVTLSDLWATWTSGRVPGRWVQMGEGGGGH